MKKWVRTRWMKSYKMNETEIAQINAAWAIITGIPARHEAAWTALAGSYIFKNDYNNPLHTYSESDLISELRTKLIKFVIAEITKNVNYEVDAQAIHNHVDAEFGRLGFDAQVIVDFITKHYESHADELSLRAIKQQVRLLAPFFLEEHEKEWERRERIPDLNELVKKDTLTLRCFLNWTYHWDYNRFMPLINAFEQYVRIELLDAKPSEVEAWQIERTYIYEESGLGVHKLSDISDIFKSAQLYKNGTLRIRFKSIEHAEQIGNAFIRDFYANTKEVTQ